MDRLEEANKVASLMRRRENPKQIPHAQLMVSASPEYRALQEPAPFPARADEARFRPLELAAFPARIVEIPERFSDPLADLARRSAVVNRTMTAESLPFMERRSSQPVVSSSKMTCSPSGLRRAGLASLSDTARTASEETRECGAALRASRALVLPAGRFSFELPGSHGVGEARDLQPLEPSAAYVPDANLRFSDSAPFEKRRPVMPHREAQFGPAGELITSRSPESEPPAARELPAAARLCSVPRIELDPQVPRLRAQPIVSSTRQGEALALLRAGYDSPSLAIPRHLRVSWNIDNPVSGLNTRRSSFRASLGSSNPLRLDASCDSAWQHRPAEVRFVPADSAFEHVSMDLHGSLGPGGEPDTAPVPIEEHFNSGMEQWQGDVSEWRLDAAGARPAGLALFRPTLALADYDFEFFTRIEARAVTFVFRASNASNYHKVSIAMVESGRYELRRRAVIGGVEEPAAVAPLPGVLRPGGAFTVRTQARQNDFSIWLDGELAARWTDGRLPLGGVGFLASRDDRARVYWVRLTPLDGLNSPAAVHRPARSIQ